jgi:hypothetical protein
MEALAGLAKNDDVNVLNVIELEGLVRGVGGRLLPMRPEDLDLPDAELGLQLIGKWVAQIALRGITHEVTEIILKATKQLPDDHVPNQLDSLLLALRLAAQGKFEQAGKKLKSYVRSRAEFTAALNLTANMDDDTRRGAKVRLGAAKAHELVHGNAVEKQTRAIKYLNLLDELRSENPNLKPRRIYELAEAESKNRFGKQISYKTFYRLEKK